MLMPTIFKAMYASWVITELYVLFVTRTRRGGNEERGGKVSDKGSLRVLWITIMVSLFLGMGIGATFRAAHFYSPAWLPLLILTLMAVGLVIRWTAIYTLGKAFSANVAIHDRMRLNRSGLFQYARHPSYTGLVLIFIAMGLTTRNWLGLAVIVIFPIAALLYRIHVEEAALTGAFGAEYVEYSRTTKRLVPGIY